MTAVPSSADKPLDGHTARRTTGAAIIVAIGIMSSRVFGVIRQILTAQFLGTGSAADAFTAAFKIPQILRNLFGEGAMSAAFIPVYSRLLARGEDEDANRLAGAVFALLALLVSVLVLIGVIAAPVLIPIIAAGFKDPTRRELTIEFTRICFPGAGIFVLSAWCLGVLNSHRKFLLSYLAPVLWNLAMIAALLWGGHAGQSPHDLAGTLAWASVIGAGLQFVVQVPATLGISGRLRLSLGRKSTHVRTVVRNFGPAFISRGVVQISGYIDQWLASFLPLGIVATLSYAQSIYLLPVSLFGTAISAAELPEMSRALGDHEEVATYLRGRMTSALRQIAFLVIPSGVAFLVLGDEIAGLLFQHGRFAARDTMYAWGVLAGAAVGLLATTSGRLYSSTFYALHDTRTPLRYAIVRVALTTILGALFALWLPGALGIAANWGAAGLTASAGIAGWVEFALLRRALLARIGAVHVPVRFSWSIWSAAAAAALASWGARFLVHGRSRHVAEVAVIGVFCLAYLVMTMVLGVPEARGFLRRLRRR